jgi:hydrogenase maturation protein HypF
MAISHFSKPVEPLERRHFHVNGVVQGVGFRPFIYRLAARLELVGWVLNSSAGVDIEVQGSQHSLEAFAQAITAEAPPLSRIDQVVGDAIPSLAGETTFVIRHSQASEGVSLVSPDMAICPDCLSEILDSANRRYRYPFTNCTNCGPRYTIISAMPYDRSLTTMQGFKMCPACRAEYNDPLNRRFHAQPNACPDCGPQVELSADAQLLADLPDLPDDIARAAALLQEGKIVAIKGLGGFHVACDATNVEAVTRLRERKARPHKPFAVMMATLDEARRHCDISPEEAELLTSAAAPIVLLYRCAGSSIAAEVAPANPMLGVMLPYTPLHHLLLHDTERPLVMTSGNLSDLPIIIDGHEAQTQLGGIADACLNHNRPIQVRCDDAIWWVDRFAGKKDVARQPLRRSRGDAPYPIRLPWRADLPILAVGAEMKNAFCLLRGNDALLSQHIGEISSMEAVEYFHSTLDHLCRLFKVTPQVIAHDLHPGYLTTRLARDLASERNLPLVAVQHHHAHIAACLAEHGRDDRVIGIALDGTGYGSDAAIWGGEVLVASLRGFERAAHLEYLPLPGGDSAIHRPYRIAWGYGLAAHGSLPDLHTLATFPAWERQIVVRQVERQVNAPPTSSCGRLFDAVAALTGICSVATFEAQAAIALELAARRASVETASIYPFTFDDNGVIHLGEMLAAIIGEIGGGRSADEIALSFHHTLVVMFVEAAVKASQKTAIKTVVLCGGSFQNRLLLRLMRQALRDQGFEVLTHRQVPANDGGLSLGQAAIALYR